MKQFAIGIIILEISLRINGLYTIVECPADLRKDIAEYSELKPLQISCTMQLLCPPLQNKPTNYENPGYQVHEDNPDALCEMKFKINVAKNPSVLKKNPCTDLPHLEHQVLLPHSTNCSLFYKCDWGVPMLFECPEDLHFNPVHQVCDWPWQAGCDSSWIGCPRPFPRCPTRYPGLLPHPFLCDRFYQCDWGTPRLQACPAGLHFDSRLKLCNWSYNSNCRNC
ncbi:peritrophin-1-like [Nylanderia fulva]|uniref:peritrophin-1-like n=1 Tax=Nylanderia fulva TaxID=613905 RepID=UPI0010FB5021|nr:peritrophin-1-like [Nylanderia fulva]